MECRCNEAEEFTGADAEAYLANHLVTDADGTYSCPDTGARWKLDEAEPQMPRIIRS